MTPGRHKRVLHFFSNLSSLGGVESILRLHAKADSEYGIDSAMVIACEAGGSSQDKSDQPTPLYRLGIRGWHFMSDLRVRFSKAFEEIRPKKVVFHNAWACRHLVDLVGDAQCILMIHTDSGVSRNAIVKCRGFTDHAISVSGPIADFLRTQIEPRRVTVLGYPITPPEWTLGDVRPDRLRIGYVGRLVIEQKRVERLPALLKAIKEMGLEANFELLGDGDCRPMLERELPPISKTIFHGRLGGEAYWNALRHWDMIVFTSDYEGTPISLLEALSQGVIPIFPAIFSGGDDIIQRVDSKLIYAAGDTSDAARVIKYVSSLNDEERHSLRIKLITAVKTNRPSNYMEDFQKTLEQVSDLKNRVVQKSSLSKPPLSLLPFAAIRRINPNLIY